MYVLVGEVGLEPTRAKSSQDFESGVSTIPPLAHIINLMHPEGAKEQHIITGRIILY